MKKYELTSDTKETDYGTVYRIRALKAFGDVKAGDYGGWVSGEHKLLTLGEGNIFQIRRQINDVDDLTAQIEELDAQTGNYSGIIAELNAEYDRLGDELTHITAEQGVYQAKLNDIAAAQERVRDQIKDQYSPLISGTEELVASMKDLDAELTKQQGGFAQTRSEAEAQSWEIKNLAAQTQLLAEQSTRTAAEEQELAGNISALNRLVPELNLSWDKQTESLSRTREEMLGFGDAQAAALTYTEGQKALTEIIENQTKAQLAYNQAVELRAGLEGQRADILARMSALENEHGAVVSENINEYSALADQYIATTFAIDELGTQMEAAAAQESAFAEQRQGMSATVAEAWDTIQDAERNGIYVLEESVKRQDELAKEQEKITAEKVAAITKAEEQLAADMQKAFDRYSKYTLDGLSRIKEGSSVSMSEMIGNMKANQASIDAWMNDLQKIADRGADVDFLKMLRDMGPEQAKLIDEIANSSESKFTNLQPASAARRVNRFGTLGVQRRAEATYPARHARRLSNGAMHPLTRVHRAGLVGRSRVSVHVLRSAVYLADRER
jgi:chromosome segregation ATPase